MPIDPWWKAEASASEVLANANITSLPVDPFHIAGTKDIFCQENPSLSEGISGCLMRVGDAFGIIYSARFQSPGYRRFTVGHELGHYFLEGHVDQLFQNGQSIHTSSSGFVSDDRYEQEADAFSAALLMPRNLFRRACTQFEMGIDTVLGMSSLCEMSLTSTAIRYAQLSTEPVAVVVSAQQRVVFSIMSPNLRKQRNLAWLKKGIGIPQSTPTYTFGQDAENIAFARTLTGDSTLEDWFDGPDTELKEEVIGLGSYGCVLTVLSAGSLADPDETITRADGRMDDEAESLLPSERFYQRTRY
jgi:IrrE N-terminal-like domain